jgi:hypothetical protein
MRATQVKRIERTARQSHDIHEQQLLIFVWDRAKRSRTIVLNSSAARDSCPGAGRVLRFGRATTWAESANDNP